MESDFQEEVSKAISASPLNLVYQKTIAAKSGGFGNAYVEFESRFIKLRFARDRSEIGLTFSIKSKSAWWPIDYLCEIKGAKIPGNDLGSNIKLLESLTPWMEDAFSEKNVPALEAKIEAVRSKRLQRIFER
jgi:hypothetical protein